MKRELAGYFATPVAYVLIVVFLMLCGIFSFSIGGLYERNQADLRSLFTYLPWLYLFLIPAVSMRLWAEERRSGTIELLLTLPISLGQAVVGKFLAAWAFTGVALALTFPIWLVVTYLGDPDNGAIVAGYIGAFLMAGGFLAIGACVSATTRNQVIAFVVTVLICFGFLLSGFDPVMQPLESWLPTVLLDAVASFGFLSHFDSISKGVVDARDLVFFGSLIAFWLFANAVVLDLRKAS
jgi:ABC-2 type transport system permease protein